MVEFFAQTRGPCHAPPLPDKRGMTRLRRIPPLNALRTFEAAARNGSFLMAASELNVTPGAVSRMIKALEEHLDITLFRRQHRAVTLTEEGQRYADSIAQALDLIHQATDHLVLGSNKNALSMCCHPTFAVHWLLPRWARFQALHPDIQINLKTTLAPEAMNLDAFDIIISIGQNTKPHEDDGIVSERLVDVESFPVCSPDLLNQTPLDQPEDLNNHVLLHGALRPNDWPRWLKAAGINEVPWWQGPTFESLTLAYNAAIAGAGVVIGMHAFVAEDLAGGRLIKPFDFVRSSQKGFNMTYRSERLQRFRAIRTFRDWLLHERTLERRQGGVRAT